MASEWVWTLLVAYGLAFAFVVVAQTLRDPVDGDTAPTFAAMAGRGLLIGTVLAVIGGAALISVSLLAVYFVIWWTVLFAVLPFGARSQADAATVVPGTEPAAPIRPRIAAKSIATTIIATVLFAVFYWVRFQSGLTLDDIPFQRELRY